ncbi:MAG: type VII secretion protein EssC [Chloroflexi bacterium]|nr:type VII secretion protein EssC [Chloroflexota bacterium]
MEYRMLTARRRTSRGFDEMDVRAPADVPLAQLARMIVQSLGWDGAALHSIEQCGASHTLDESRTPAQLGLCDGAMLNFGSGTRASAGALRAPLLSGPRVRLMADALLGGELELAAPPALPSKPRMAWPSIVLPALFSAGTLAASIALHSNGNGAMNFMMSGYMLLSTGMALLNYRRDQHAWSQAMRDRETTYRTYLVRRREQLHAAATQQLVLAQEEDPDVMRLVRRALTGTSVWTCEPGDGVVLAARLGAGRAPLQVRIKPPRYEPLLQPDPLGDAALALCAEAHEVEGMPLRIDIGAQPALGMAGPRAATIAAAQSLLLNLAVHYAPQQLRIAAIFPREEVDAWSWLRWLPHTWFDESDERALACESIGAARVLERVGASLVERAEHRTHTLLVLADERACDGDARLNLLLSAHDAPLTSLHFAPKRDALPRRCTAFVEYEGGRARVHVQSSSPRMIDAPDQVSLESCGMAARALAALPHMHTSAVAGIPNMVPLLDLWKVRDVQQIDVAARWQSAAHLDAAALRVPIGRGAGGALLELDLRDGDRGHGAHGLVAGMTGAGKSELLQTLVTSLALRFHPDWLAFLLIDYKGGGMAGAFESDGASGSGDLPHLAGVMTNLLDAGSARRALVALDSELKRRQRVFEQYNVTYIDAYQKLYAADVSGALASMPRLVIIVDEFAELKRDQPEFMKQLISAARIGRSLGVHLILATQKPSGVVDEQIWSNSRFKLCLRVQDDGDSKEMLKRPDAARLRQSGRAYFMVGRDERFEEFQSAYGGAPYLPEIDVDAEARFVAPMTLDGHCDMTRAVHAAVPVAASLNPLSQLQALTRHMCETAATLQVRPVERIWLEPLPALLAWDDVRLREPRAVLRAVVGLLDEPRARRQVPLCIDLQRDGHLMIFGQTGSGKSVLLQRLVLELARTHTLAELNVTILDFGSRSLRPLEALPHVADVLTEDDDERLGRLFRRMRRELARRKALLDGRKLAELRVTNPEFAPPAWLLVIDNYPAFARTEHDESLAVIVRDGPALGVHVVLSANKPLDVRSRISGNIPTALCLQQADRADYAAAVGRTGGLEPVATPGRGLAKTAAGPLEFQTALPCVGNTDAERFVALQRVAQDMCALCGDSPLAVRVPSMPELLMLSDLPSVEAGGSTLVPPIGLQTLDLELLRLPLSEAPHVVVTGTPASGKSMLLRTLVSSLVRTYLSIPLRLVLVDATGAEDGLHSLAGLSQVRHACVDESAFALALTEAETSLSEWRTALASARAADPSVSQSMFAQSLSPLVFVIDDADVLARGLSRPMKERLDVLLDRGARGWPLHFVLAGTDRGLDPVDGWVKRVKDAGSWFVLGGLQSVGYALRLPTGERDRPLPAGQGYFVSRRQTKPLRIRVAQP